MPIFTEHVEKVYDFCAGGADADDFASSTSLTYFLVPGVQRFACAPVGRRLLTGRAPGSSRSGAASTAPRSRPTPPSTSAPRPSRPAPARSSATRHLRLLSALSGQSSGGAVRDLWLDRDGLVVKEERQVALRVRSGFVGLLSYEEQASFLLTRRP